MQYDQQQSMEVLSDLPGQQQLLYFTTSSITQHDDALWYINEIMGQPNLHRMDLTTGKQNQLTQNNDGRLWQYQGFGGHVNKGLGVWSMALDHHRDCVYHIHGQHICVVDQAGDHRRIAQLPEDETTAFIDISDCGQWLCVPTTDKRALGHPTEDHAPLGGSHAMDHRCQIMGLNSYLNVYHTGTGQLEKRISVPRCWITHVQFRPGQPEQILYNHEWASMTGTRRMWLWDGQTHQCLRPSDEVHHHDDYIVHEVWNHDGSQIIYHGQYRDGPAMVGKIDLTRQKIHEVSLPENWQRYGHYQIGYQSDHLLVCDGYYETDQDEPGAARWLSLVNVDWDQQTLQWTPLCQHHSLWNCQDSHPHPIFDHAGNFIYFTGTVDGRRRVCRIPINQRG